jgi:hypothetical protein
MHRATSSASLRLSWTAKVALLRRARRALPAGADVTRALVTTVVKERVRFYWRLAGLIWLPLLFVYAYNVLPNADDAYSYFITDASEASVAPCHPA